MKRVSNKQVMMVFVLGMLVTAAVFALTITYMAYLPTITAIPLEKSDAWLGEAFYRIARNSFCISGASGLILGLAIPVIFRVYKLRFGRSDKPDAEPNGGPATPFVNSNTPGGPPSVNSPLK